MIAVCDVRAGDVVAYKLLSKDSPTHPDRLWYGRVLLCSVSSKASGVSSMKVALLDVGYEQYTEVVYPSQITSITRNGIAVYQVGAVA